MADFLGHLSQFFDFFLAVFNEAVYPNGVEQVSFGVGEFCHRSLLIQNEKYTPRVDRFVNRVVAVFNDASERTPSTLFFVVVLVPFMHRELPEGFVEFRSFAPGGVLVLPG
jgi:hypothetical protein